MNNKPSQGMIYLAVLTAALFLALMAVALFPTEMTPYRQAVAMQYSAPGMKWPPRVEDTHATFFYETQKIVIINQGDDLNPLVKGVPYQ